jgi:hypothetical protein
MSAAAEAREADQAPHWRAMVTACLAHRDELNEWERVFLASVDGKARISPKQFVTLAAIVWKVGECGTRD